MTKHTFTPIRQKIRSDGRITYYSTAHEAMAALETAHHDLEHLERKLLEAQVPVFQARERYQDALNALENELIKLYGDDMPEAFEMPFGVLALDREDGPRLLASRSWADTFRIDEAVENPIEEAA